MASSTTTAISLTSPDFLSTLNPRPNSSLSLRRPTKLNQSLSLASTTTLSTKKPTVIWRTQVAEAPPPEAATQLEAPPDIVSDGASTVISALLVAAFVGLTVLTIGVIYIGVTDFLQKREREKFEKEEEAVAKKNKGKKKKPKARAGPRGFGQKIDDDVDEIND